MPNDEFSKRLSSGTHATAGVTIQRRADDLYAVWRGLTDLPRFIDDLERIETLDDRRSVWTVRGPAGQMAVRALKIMGAERVIVIDRLSDRLEVAARAGCETFNTNQGDVYEHLLEQTAGRGPDACLDAVGMEAHGHGLMGVVDRVKQSVGIESDRPGVLREMIMCVRKAGTISVLGVYSGMVDSLPFGVAFNKSVRIRMGQVKVQAYQRMLLDLILEGRIDPSEIITHRMALDDAADAYRMFDEKRDGCLKVVLRPGKARNAVVSGREQRSGPASG